VSRLRLCLEKMSAHESVRGQEDQQSQTDEKIHSHEVPPTLDVGFRRRHSRFFCAETSRMTMRFLPVVYGSQFIVIAPGHKRADSWPLLSPDMSV